MLLLKFPRAFKRLLYWKHLELSPWSCWKLSELIFTTFTADDSDRVLSALNDLGFNVASIIRRLDVERVADGVSLCQPTKSLDLGVLAKLEEEFWGQ